MKAKPSPATDSTHKGKPGARIVSLVWMQDRVSAESRAAFEVRTLYIAQGVPIVVTCCTGEGRKLDVVEGLLRHNRFQGEFRIPGGAENCDSVYFEVAVAKCDLSGESDRIPVVAAS